MMPLVDFDSAWADLERHVQSCVLRGLTVTLEVDRAPTVPQLRRLEEMLLDQHGAQLLQVVEVDLPHVEGGGEAADSVPRAADREDAGPADGAPAGSDGATAGAGGEEAAVDGRRSRTRNRRPRATGRAQTGGRPGGPSAHGFNGGEPRRSPLSEQIAHGSEALPAGAGPWSAMPAEHVPTMLVKRTLRSGQRIRFAGNVVVLGDVNPGAEVVAAGDIVVMGTLRGVAHAGATGGDEAIVAAFRLLPTQLRVGGVIGRAPDGRAPRPDAPEVARVRDGVLVVERYVPQ